MFKSNGTLSSAPGSLSVLCSSATASLYAIDDVGRITDQTLGSSAISSDGTFKFSAKASLTKLKSSNVQFVIKAKGCGSEFCRPLTDTKDQLVSGVSTLVCMSSEVPGNRSLGTVGKTEVISGMKSLSSVSGANSLLDLVDALISDSSLASSYENLTGVPVQKLKELPPSVVTYVAPLDIREVTANTYQTSVNHWNSDYEMAYQWKVDGTVVGTTSSYIYTTGKNSQGLHELSVTLGSKGVDGFIDFAKPTKTEVFRVFVSNDYPALPPSFSLVTPVAALGVPVSTRSITLGVATGTSLSGCESFSRLALTENTLGIPAVSDFNITCSTSVQQPFDVDLVSSGDGLKILRLWAIDAAGNMSITPSSLNLYVDTSAPVVGLGAGLPVFSNSTSQTVTFSANDNGGSISHYECRLNSDSYSICTNPKTFSGLTQGVHSVSIRAIDTAGNTSSAVTHTWTVDTTAPVMTITSPASDGNLLAVSSLNNVSVSGTCESGSGIVFSGASNSSASCVGGVWNTTFDFSALADGILTLSATQTDAAGNSTIQTRTFIKDTQGPTISWTSTPSSPQKGGGSFNAVFTVTETHITTAQSFTISYSTDNGATWTDAGTIPAITGPLSSQSFSYIVAFPAGVSSSQSRLRVTGSDAAGNLTTSPLSIAFTVDSSRPTLSSVEINGGATVALSPTLTLSIDAIDSLSGVSAIRIADAIGTDCQAAYANNNWKPFINGGGAQTYSYLTGFVNGQRQICVWAKDATDNVSVITTNSNAGTEGVDMAKVRLDQGNPPSFSALAVTNGNVSSGNYGTGTFASGDAMSISFTVTDDVGLALNPVEIQMTTDNVNYTLIASGSTVGSPGAGQTSWTNTFTGVNATTGGFFRIRVIAKDANGNTAQMISPALNAGKWSLFAGNEDVGDGSSALSALLRYSNLDGSREKVVANSRNELFVATRDGLRKIDPATGNINSYIQYGTYAGVPGTVGEGSSTRVESVNNMTTDGDMIYFVSNGRLHRVNTVTNEIIRYAGGGTSVSTSDPTALFFWNAGSITMDPETKDVYFVNTCDSTVIGNSGTVSLKIQKITQNPTTKMANSVEHVAGNCVKGVAATDGSDAINSALEPTTSVYRAAHGSLVYVPQIQTLYFGAYNGKIIKIKAGKIYVSSGAGIGTSVRGGLYLPNKNKIYYSKPGTGIYSFAPSSASAFDETLTLEVKPEEQCSVSGCRESGVPLTNAALTSGSLFRIGDQLGIVDNVTNANVQGRLLVLDDSSNTLQVLAGTDRFSGDGLNRTLARFSELAKLVYKKVSTSGFPMGLYATDGTALRVLQMNPAESTIHVRAGNGVSTWMSEGIGFDPLSPLGVSAATSTSFRLLSLNPLNHFTFYSGNTIWSVKADATIEGFLSSSGSSIFARSDGYVGKASKLQNGEHKAGLIYDASGNLYFGGYQDPATQTTSSGYGKIMVRRADGSFYTVLGTNTLASSSDCSTPGCAQAKTVNFASNNDYAGSVLLGEYDERFNANEGRLLFSEQTKIRFVSRAWDPSNSTYGTLADSTGTPVNFGRQVGAFVYTYVDNTSEQIDRVYYISNDSKLYCKKLSAGSDANCTNTTALGPTTGLPSFSSSTIAFGPSGEIYVVNSSQNAIYKYNP